MPKKPIKTNILDDRRLDILKASLSHVPFDGWTMMALNRGGASLGISPSEVKLLFSGGEEQMLALFSHYVNQQMIATLTPHTMEGLKIREKIRTCVITRLSILGPHREAIRRLLSTLLMPRYGMLKHRLMFQAVDSMWRVVGDNSTDFNFYTKRGILSGVYLSTLLYWIMDDSKDYEDTKAFVDRRLDDVMQIPAAKARVKDIVSKIPNPVYFLKPTQV